VIHEPPVLILDEPTTGLDVLASSAMIEFIESRRAAGTCVLFSTHVLSEAERLCDRIGVIFRGRLLAAGTLSELSLLTGKRWLADIFLELVRRGGASPVEAPAEASVEASVEASTREDRGAS
jgi:sodium transport system ATP-binding protein